MSTILIVGLIAYIIGVYCGALLLDMWYRHNDEDDE